MTDDTDHDHLVARVAGLEEAVRGLTEWAHSMQAGCDAALIAIEERLIALEPKP